MHQNNESIPAAFTVEYHGLKVACDTIEHVVEAMRAFEREVPVPMHAEPVQIVAPLNGASPIATAMYALFRTTPSWRRPVEIVRALKRQRIQGAKYTSVYAVLRYGDFVKREGRWNVSDAHAAL